MIFIRSLLSLGVAAHYGFDRLRTVPRCVACETKFLRPLLQLRLDGCAGSCVHKIHLMNACLFDERQLYHLEFKLARPKRLLHTRREVCHGSLLRSLEYRCEPLSTPLAINTNSKQHLKFDVAPFLATPCHLRYGFLFLQLKRLYVLVPETPPRRCRCPKLYLGVPRGKRGAVVDTGREIL